MKTIREISNEGQRFFSALSATYHESTGKFVLYKAIVVDIDNIGGFFFKLFRGDKKNPPGTIRARIPGIHRGLPDDQCPFFFPLLPSHLVLPDVGEVVWIIFENLDHKHSGWWIDRVVGVEKIDISSQTYKDKYSVPEKDLTGQPPDHSGLKFSNG